MGIIIVWIVTGITAAWTLISGVAGAAGATALASAVALLPNKMGTAAAEWVAVANFFVPVNECVTLFLTFCSIASLLRVARWTALLKK